MLPQTQDLIRQVLKIDSRDDLAMINRAIIAQMRHVARMATANFQVGDQVEFTGKNGARVQGHVIKVNAKNIKVDTLMGKWNVSASLLRSIS